jgi:hypothetical protein
MTKSVRERLETISAGHGVSIVSLLASKTSSNIRKFVLIDEDVVVGRATGAENSPVTQQIKVKFDGVDHVAVDNSASDAIPASVTLILRTREKPNVVPLADYDKSDRGFEFQLSTCTYVDVSC